MDKNKQTKKGVTIDDLAGMIQNGFLELKTEIREIKTDVAVLKADVAEIKTDVEEIKTTIDNIKGDLNKKVDKIEHNTLNYRVEKLEKKFA